MSVVFLILLFPALILSKVNINEIFYNIPDSPGWDYQDQWIELFNFSTDKMTMNSWRLETSTGDVFTFSISLDPNQRVIFVADSSKFITHWDSCLSSATLIVEYGSSVNVCHDVGGIDLKDSQGEKISSVSWGGTGTSPAVSPGYSLGLFPESNYNPSPEDFTVCKPTPGETNSEVPASAINPSTWGRIKAMFSTEHR